MYCPKCRSEFRDGFTSCPDCSIPLAESLPAEVASSSLKGWLDGWVGGDRPRKVLIVWFALLGLWGLYNHVGIFLVASSEFLFLHPWRRLALVALTLLSCFAAWQILAHRGGGRLAALAASALGLLIFGNEVGFYLRFAEESGFEATGLSPREIGLLLAPKVLKGLGHLGVLLYVLRFGVGGVAKEPDLAEVFS